MNYKKIKQIYNKLKKYDVTFVGYGIQTTDGISKGIGLIAGVEKKQVFPEKKIPEKIFYKFGNYEGVYFGERLWNTYSDNGLVCTGQ